MNQDKLNALMASAGINRKQFAQLIGCHVKTTYWKAVPHHAKVILKQQIKLARFNNLSKALKEIMIDVDHEVDFDLMCLDDDGNQYPA